MPHISVDNNLRITESMVVEAIVLAEKGQIEPVNSEYDNSKLENAIYILEGENSFSKSQKINALKYVIDKRQKFIYILHSIRKKLPKWLLKEIPIGLVGKELKSISIINKLKKTAK